MQLLSRKDPRTDDGWEQRTLMQRQHMLCLVKDRKRFRNSPSNHTSASHSYADPGSKPLERLHKITVCLSKGITYKCNHLVFLSSRSNDKAIRIMGIISTKWVYLSLYFHTYISNKELTHPISEKKPSEITGTMKVAGNKDPGDSVGHIAVNI